MRAISATLIFIFALGCASTPDATPANPSKDSLEPPIVVSKRQAPADIKLSGQNFYLDRSHVRSGLSAATIEKLTDLTRVYFKALGFKEVGTRRKAHLIVFLYADKYSPEKVGSPAQMLFQLAVSLSRYGTRPTDLGFASFEPPAEQWTGHEDQLIAVYPDVINDLMPKAPAQNEKMQGDPGCVLRFGFEEDGGKITDVLKGSPAAKAGMKVGDVVESIDSIPYEQSARLDLEGAYQPNLKVPLKLKRGEKTIRSELTAQVVCD